jgi:hypothetical protein
MFICRFFALDVYLIHLRAKKTTSAILSRQPLLFLILIKVNGIIRTCPKASLSAAFRRFGIERRQPSCNLNIQKSAENSSLSGRRIFTEQIFGQSRHKTEQILCGFASLLTTSERKYARENHGSYYSIHLMKI